jgi:DNA-directed RNA polymerase specialized sigma24 family protein
MKSLANRARKAYKTAGKLEYSSSAAQTYKEEVGSLEAKLHLAALNAPRERRARVIANSKVKAKVQEHPELSKKENKKLLNKIERIAIEEARASVGASGKNTRINITDREWDAIQAGAISDTKLTQILRYTDPDVIKQRAMPKATTTLSNAQISKIASMKASGYTIAQIAERLGKSSSTISKYLNS